jgi:hypothetical protein
MAIYTDAVMMGGVDVSAINLGAFMTVWLAVWRQGTFNCPRVMNPVQIWCLFAVQLWVWSQYVHFYQSTWKFQSKALHMIVDAPWYVQNTVIRTNLQTSGVKEEILRYSSQYSARLRRPSSEPHGATRQQAIAETPAKWSAYQIPTVIVVFVVLILGVCILLRVWDQGESVFRLHNFNIVGFYYSMCAWRWSNDRNM